MRSTNNNILSAVGALPEYWHASGCLNTQVLETIAEFAEQRNLDCTLETGSGKSTLLFSHISRNHKVFACVSDDDSIKVVKDSPLFRSETVEFVEGPTQLTLPRYTFAQRLQMALIDGPHGYPFPQMEYYYIYPHLEEDGLLIVDDIHIPTVHHLFEFLREDKMFKLERIVETTAFFKRTAEAPFDPTGDGWWLQSFNNARFPVTYRSPLRKLARMVRHPLRELVISSRNLMRREGNSRPIPGPSD